MAKSIKLNSDLWERIEEFARRAGYSSADEFVQHVLEKELAREEDEQSQKEVERRLRGLGYID
jgi:metal-responsive CopG/Arc/MetJ family transcriptional regulator